MDFSEVLRALWRLFGQKGVNPRLFLQQKQELIINVDALSGRLQVLINYLSDLCLRIFDDFVFQRDEPKLRLFSI